MMGINEVEDYLKNKRQIFIQIIDAIKSAQQQGLSRIYIKGIKLMGEEVDVIANRDAWPGCLQKAIKFFEETEDYETCQICKEIQSKIKIPKKKTRKNGK